MSKKLSTVLLTAVMLILILSGCGCEHEVVFDEGYPASCTQDGLSDGEHCALCGKVLKSRRSSTARDTWRSVCPKPNLPALNRD